MQLGVGPFTCQRPPFDNRSMGRIYADMLELARTADRVGLDSIWVSEHHFVDDGYMSGPLPALAAIAAATTQIAVGTSISLVPFHHPLRLAEDAATIDLIAGGRLRFGVGIGYRDREFDVFGVDKSARPKRIEDAVGVLRGAWSPGPLDYESDVHDIPADVTVTPKPDRVPPILFAGQAEPAVERAARLGDGWLTFPSETPEGIRTRRRFIETVRDDEAIDRDFTIYAGGRGFVAASREEAWDTIKDGLFHMRRTYAEFGFPTAQEFLGADSIDELPDETIERMKDDAIIGSPDDVIEQLAAYRDAAGDDAHFVFRVFIPGVGVEPLTECLELLGNEVQPHFA